MTLTAEQTAKFWSQVRKGIMKGDCWLWTGGQSAGYGVMFINKYQVCVHRISYMLHFGPVDAKTFIRRTCKQRFCVNPAHLELAARKTISINKKGTHISFDERCKRDNAKKPIAMTELRDRMLAQHGGITLSQEARYCIFDGVPMSRNELEITKNFVSLR